MSRKSQQLHARVDQLIEHIYNDAMPEDRAIKRTGINEIKRWRLTLSPSAWKKFWSKLTPQQKQSCPNYDAAP
jgi:hypothetical protein